MNEFDELFDDNPKQELITNKNGIDDFNNYVDKQKKNGLLLLIYIVISFLFSLGLQFVTSNQFPDTDLVLENMVEVTEVAITVSDNTDSSSEYPYIFHITGSLVNNYTEELPVAYYEIEFFDTEGESVGVYTYTENNLPAGEVMTMDEEIESSIQYDTFTVGVGFDVAATVYTLFNLLPVIVVAFAFFIVDRDSFKADGKNFKKNKKLYISQIFVGFFMVYAALLVANLILQVLGVLGTSENEMAIQGLFTSDPLQLVMLFLLLCVFTPIVEEVVFRKIIYNFVEPRTNYKVAIAATGIIFGLMHVLAFGDLVQSIPYILMGLTFGFIYYRANKNIYVTIGVHFLNNLLSYVVYFLAIVFGISI